MNALLLSVLLAAAAPVVEVTLASPIPGVSAPMPCRFGVVLPPGLAERSCELRAFERTSGPAVAVDWEPVTRWPDGTLRWVRGRASLELAAGRPRRLLVRAVSAAESPPIIGAANLRFESDERFHDIVEDRSSSGSGRRLRARRDGGPFPWGVEGADTAWFVEGRGPELVWTHRDGGRIPGIVATVEPKGEPGRAAVLVARGTVEHGAVFRTTATVWAGSFLLQLETRIEGWPAEASAAGFEFGWPGTLTEVAYRAVRTRRIRRRPCRRLQLDVATGGAVELAADERSLAEESGVPATLGLGFGRTWLLLGLGDAAVRGGVRVVAEEGRVRVVLREGVECWNPERRLALGLTFGFVTGPPRAAHWNAVEAAAGYGGAIASMPSGQVERWGGLGPWPDAAPDAPAEEATRETLVRLIEGMARPECRGPEDFGDYRVPSLGWANAEYDAIRVLVRGHCRTRDPETFAWVRRAVRHHLDVDLDWKHTGLPRVHGPDHDGGTELGHTWIRGLLAHALLSGDEESLAAARGIARGIVSWLHGTRGALRRERDYGWTLLALSTAAELLPGEGFEAARDGVAADLRPFLHDRGLLLLELTRNPSVARTATFTVLGVVVPAMVAFARSAGRPEWGRRAREVVQRYLAEAWDPETERLAWTLFADASSAEVIGRAGSVDGAELMFLAAGIASAAGDEDGGWTQRQARRLLARGLRSFRRAGDGVHDGERVRALSALLDLGAEGRSVSGARADRGGRPRPGGR